MWKIYRKLIIFFFFFFKCLVWFVWSNIKLYLSFLHYRDRIAAHYMQYVWKLTVTMVCFHACKSQKQVQVSTKKSRDTLKTLIQLICSGKKHSPPHTRTPCNFLAYVLTYCWCLAWKKLWPRFLSWVKLLCCFRLFMDTNPANLTLMLQTNQSTENVKFFILPFLLYHAQHSKESGAEAAVA